MRFRRVALSTCIATGLSVMIAHPLAQKGKPVPPIPDIAGESVLRCEGSDALCGDELGVTYDDGIAGVQSEITALSGTDQQFRLRLLADSGTDRHFTIRFPSSSLEPSSFECENDATYGCFAVIPEDGIVLASPLADVEHAGMATAGTSALMTGLAVGATTQTTFIIGFPDPDRAKGYRWALYWNPSMYAGTTLATITRESACTWIIGADQYAVAGLLLFQVPKGKRGRPGESYEGRFQMPFEIRFTAKPGSMPGCA